MNDADSDALIRRAIGGDHVAIEQITSHAETTDSAVVIAMAALLEHEATRLARAGSVAVTTRDRQIVEIARAHLAQRDELVDALARDHLVDHPDSLIVAWIASDAAREARSGRPV